jgi:hypothetical protein
MGGKHGGCTTADGTSVLASPARNAPAPPIKIIICDDGLADRFVKIGWLPGMEKLT